MKYECGMIEDLLPLYKDGACSEASRKAITEHLTECEKCRGLWEELKNDRIEAIMVKEREDVIGSQSKYFKRKSALIGSIIACIFAVPILVCLIVNLASGHGLGWFFIVLAAMLLPTSLFAVPLMAPRNRMLLTMSSFTLSLIFLLAVICLYSRGKWFFVVASSVLFGLTVCFGPFIACRRPVKPYLKNCKGLTVMAADTVTFFLMMLCIGLYVATPGYFRLAFIISVPQVAIVWVLFLIIRYLPANGLAKGGICTVILSLFTYFEPLVVMHFTLLASGKAEVLVYSEPSVVFALAGAGIGVVIAIIGLITGRKAGKKA